MLFILCASEFHIFYSSILQGMTLRPDRPSSLPNTTQSRGRIKQIHIPVIIPPPSSSPNHPAQTNRHMIRISKPNQHLNPQHPRSPTLPLAPGRPVVETGQAGPPGYIRRLNVRRGAEDSLSTPVRGFAGTPGELCWRLKLVLLQHHCLVFCFIFFNWLSWAESLDALNTVYEWHQFGEIFWEIFHPPAVRVPLSCHGTKVMGCQFVQKGLHLDDEVATIPVVFKRSFSLSSLTKEMT